MKNLLLAIAILATHFGLAQSTGKPTDYLSSQFHKERRAKLRDKLPNNSVAVFFSNPVRNRSNDVDYVYHQDPNFYYFTGHREPHSVLLIFKEEQKVDGSKFDELIFVRQKDPLGELYEGYRLGKAGAKKELDFKIAFEGPDFENFNLDFSRFDKVFVFRLSK